MWDAIIVGAGVCGCAIARELSRKKGRFLVVEKKEDVCCGTSKANSGIVHAGFDAKHGTRMAQLNVRGSGIMPRLSRELDVPFRQNGSLVVMVDPGDRPRLQALYEDGLANGVPGLEILEREELLRLEPHISDQAVAALYAPTGGIVCPFALTIALAENACENGVEFSFNTGIRSIEKHDTGYVLKAEDTVLYADCIVNAAGVYADVFHNMVSEKKIHITPRKGDYCLLDKEAGSHVSHTIFQLPGKLGKGILVAPTVHGNLLTGPTAKDIEDKECTATTAEGLAEVMQKAGLGVKDIPFRQVITSFCGLRAHEDGDDFIIGEAEDAPGFFDAAGIESPGLSSAPAIGVYLAELVAEKLQAPRKETWNGKRKGFIRPEKMSREERAALIKEHPEYGTIICRCEGVSEGEILDAIRRSPGAVSLDGIKRRVRQGMGRCQAGFCTPRTMEILARELGVTMEEICKNAPGSNMLTGEKQEGAAL